MTIVGSPLNRLLGGLALLLAASWSAAADEPASPPADRVAAEPGAADLELEVRQSIAGLDHEEFVARQRAAEHLEKLVEDPDQGSFLASQFSRALRAPEASIEARTRLELFLKQLPRPLLAIDERMPLLAELGPLLDQLNGDSCAARDSARWKLYAMVGQVEFIATMLVEVKRRLAEAGSNLQSRRALEPLLDQVREAWLLADPAQVVLPAVTDQEMARWIDELSPGEQGAAADRFRRATAERELSDLMVRDETRPRLLAMLAERIAAQEKTATAELEQFVDFSKPAMAAEVWGHELGVWEHRQHKTVQHLIVGVPQIPDGAAKATHFDFIDDKTAHCVSGNSLTAGDYPVGIAIPHPDPGQELMYHLVNLPTPRRQLIYQYHLKRSESFRLREISERSLADILAQRRVLNESQILLLGEMDPHAVSRFVGAYFQAVPNQRLMTTTTELAGQQTVYGAICYVMTRIGTHEAVPALEKIARSGQLGLPTYESPYQIAWVAALAIAQRDPWADVDAWLARLVDETTLLVMNVDPPPELGASAAALLLERHGASPRQYGLELTGEAVIDRLRFFPYRFDSSKSRAEVRRWWEKQQDTLSKKSALWQPVRPAGMSGVS